MQEKRKCLIIGGGPAGYTAGIYASRAGLQPLLFEGMQPGGQLSITSEVENFPGYPTGESGPTIMADIRKQALHHGTEIRVQEIASVDFSSRPFLCITDDNDEILAETVVIATGAKARWLGLESEQHYRGFGVSTCATCDGNFFRGKTVAVIGGGDTALEEASYLANLCNKVYLIHRREQFRASLAMQERVKKIENIEIIYNAKPIEILGEKQGFVKVVTGVKLENTVDKAETVVNLDGIFVAIGVDPVNELFKGQIALDDYGYIKTEGARPLTNVPGVFAAGDVQDPYYRQAVTAAASGCKAAVEAEKFLAENE